MAESFYGADSRFLHTCCCIINASVCCKKFEPSADGLQKSILKSEFKCLTTSLDSWKANIIFESISIGLYEMFHGVKIPILMHSFLSYETKVVPFMSQFLYTIYICVVGYLKYTV